MTPYQCQDQEECKVTLLINSENASDALSQHDTVSIREDLSQIKVMKNSETGIPIYLPVGNDPETEEPAKWAYSIQNKRKKSPVKFPFVKYMDACLHQENSAFIPATRKCSSFKDRLLRVRAEQPNHIFSSTYLNKECEQREVKCGDLCVFNEILASVY